MTAPTTAPPALIATDRCDRCGAAAAVRVALASGGELLFCGHHSREHLPKLAEISAVIHDTRDALGAVCLTPAGAVDGADRSSADHPGPA